jgi:predicted 2-oxoglutarate/Fe(II)-dependent dioxygenase YbiX
MKTLDQYINVVHNAIPLELCDDILKEYENEEWQTATVGKGRIKTDQRNCKVIGISMPAMIKKNLQARSKLDYDIFQNVSKLMSVYSNAFEVFLEYDTGYELLKYEEGGYFCKHVDESPNNNRTVSCSLMLNDDYEGGTFAFFDGELKYDLKKGDALIFPSNYLYPHEVMPITKGTRYSIVTWFA